MAHSVTVQPALSVRAALTSCHTDLQCLLLRLDLENLQVRVTQGIPLSASQNCYQLDQRLVCHLNSCMGLLF